jgi:flagellar motor switch protein FliN/FliY
MTSHQNALARLSQNVESALSQALTSLTGNEFIVAPASGQEWPAAAESPFIWQQSISVVEGPAFWLVAPADLWEALGRQTLEAAGIDAASTEEIRSTWQEIVNQTASGVANSVAAHLVRDVAATTGELLTAEPPGVVWTLLTVSDGKDKHWLFRAGWAEPLLALYSDGDTVRAGAGTELSASRTLDLLMDVAMPVCVSFGKTSLQIREVLKLNTGSIVELNRFVSDPVDVVVNDCVIARGEVVVVDGNYGVRISHLASREDRLRTGMNDASVTMKLK